jgi:hypothetical protein
MLVHILFQQGTHQVCKQFLASVGIKILIPTYNNTCNTIPAKKKTFKMNAKSKDKHQAGQLSIP